MDSIQHLVQHIYSKYKDTIVCSDISQNIWNECIDGRWFNIDSGYTMYRIIDDLIKSPDSVECEINKIKDYHFRHRIFNRAAELLLNPTFEEQLDTDRQFLGFNNGVFDLTTKTLRALEPWMKISMNTRYDYQEYSRDDSAVFELTQFIRRVLPDKDNRIRFWKVCASFCNLCDLNSTEMIIWSGIDTIGKSRLMHLIERTFGDYYALIDTGSFKNPDLLLQFLLTTQSKKRCVFLEGVTERLLIKMAEYNDLSIKYQTEPRYKLINMLYSQEYNIKGELTTVVSFNEGFDWTTDVDYDRWKKPLMWLLINGETVID